MTLLNKKLIAGTLDGYCNRHDPDFVLGTIALPHNTVVYLCQTLKMLSISLARSSAKGIASKGF